MADEGRSVYWPIMVAACIGALGTVAAAVVGKVNVGSVFAPPSGSAAPKAAHRAGAAAKPDTGALALPADWIDARGRYYRVRQAGATLGVIAYDGGQRALDKDKVRLTGDGTLDGGKVQWSWAGDKAKHPEHCTGRASASAITLRCARDDGGDGYDLRLVAR